MPYRICDREKCNNRYYVRPYALKRGMGRYCSKTCSNIASNPASARRIPTDIEQAIIQDYLDGMSLQDAGERHGYGRGGAKKVLERNAIPVRSTFATKIGRPFTHSHRAAIAANHADVSGSKNPMYGRSPGHGKAIFIQHLNKSVRSTWEATITNILYSREIPHEYETRRIPIDNNTTYLPDFYLPQMNKYIEVKGWMNQRAKNILEAVSQQRPEINLIVIDETAYKHILEHSDYLVRMLDLEPADFPVVREFSPLPHKSCKVCLTQVSKRNKTGLCVLCSRKLSEPTKRRQAQRDKQGRYIKYNLP